MANERFGTDKDVEDLIRRARRSGWEVTVDGGTHLRWEAPGGGGFRCALTGGSSVVARVRSQLRRLDPETFGAGRPPATMPEPPDPPQPVAPPPPAPPVAVDLKGALAAASAATSELATVLAATEPFGDPDALADTIRAARNDLRAVEDELRRRARSSRWGG